MSRSNAGAKSDGEPCQEQLPTVDGDLFLEFSFTDPASSRADLPAKVGIASKRENSRRQARPVALVHRKAEIAPPDNPGDFAIPIADENCRASGCRDSVKFARHNQTFEFGPEAN